MISCLSNIIVMVACLWAVTLLKTRITLHNEYTIVPLSLYNKDAVSTLYSTVLVNFYTSLCINLTAREKGSLFLDATSDSS